MRVAHRHLHRRMAEEFRDRPQRGAAHHQPRGEGVSQIVPGEVLDPGHLERGVGLACYDVPRSRPYRCPGYVWNVDCDRMPAGTTDAAR